MTGTSILAPFKLTIAEVTHLATKDISHEDFIHLGKPITTTKAWKIYAFFVVQFIYKILKAPVAKYS